MAESEKLTIYQGNEFFRTEKWAQAADKYRDAALLDGPKPIYMSNLAAALLKLEQYAACGVEGDAKFADVWLH